MRMQANKNYEILRPMYPLLIQQFVDDYNLSEGVAIDIGVGRGYLGIELAKITNMDICFLDIDADALKITKDGIDTLDIDNRISYVQAAVENIPLDSDYADFIMSRGSLWFWNNPIAGLKEIHRILKPNGAAVIGGGLGRYIPATMRKRMMDSIKQRLQKSGETRPGLAELQVLAKEAGIPHCRFFNDGADGVGGRWIEMRK